MNRVLIFFFSLMAICCLNFPADAAEKGFVNFENGEIVDKVPEGKEKLYGEIRNKRQPAGDIDPIAVGNFWVYESIPEEEGEELKSTYVLYITRKVEIAGETWFEYHIDSDGPQFLQRCDEENIYFKQNDNPARKQIARKPQLNEAFVNEGGIFAVMALDAVVELKWGKVKCVELVNVHDDEAALPQKEKIIETLWYHPGVGIVAIDAGLSRYKLIGFNVSN